MEKYSSFIESLKEVLKFDISSPSSEWRETAFHCVDGLAGSELRRLVPLQTRKENGAFFTDSKLATQVLNALQPEFDANSFVYDPACGAGNLLIAAAEFIIESGISLKLKKQLLGTDIHQEFVDASRLRLKIREVLLTCEPQVNNKKDVEYKISLRNGLEFNNYYKLATHIFVNPPFNKIVYNGELNWAGGSVSNAALFIDKIIENTNPGVCIIAILPDVLRSGSRYAKWRKMVNETCEIQKIELLGKFDDFADVDVFAIKMLKRGKRATNGFEEFLPGNDAPQKTVASMFNICVGRVVDYRDPKKGPLLGYVVSKGLRGWGEENCITFKRKHLGLAFISPFVVIKRTSRLGDSHRAIATIINDSNPVFVDNHLIVLQPKSGKLADCRKILKTLKSDKTDEWINNQIRCRHLTVKVVSNIPIIP
ncbi:MULTISPECIES: N-6 DNA methylase [unclassified Chitinophaga]|uniref:N-6 DNA methylase n=1 Tax=unclassified Chitinophaga TaxID=2619133 RepID=UPI00300FC144